MSNLENQTPKLPEDPEPQFGQNDEELIGMIETLRPVPDRDPLAEARSRAQFMAGLKAMNLLETTQLSNRRFFNRLRKLLTFNKKEEPEMNTSTQRFTFSALALIAILMVFLFGGTGTTVYAAQNALPGDALYPVKTSVEQAQVSLSGDAASRAELYLHFADQRMDEISRLVAGGRYDHISTATSAYASNMAYAASELELVAKSNPARSAELSREIAAELARYAQALTAMEDRVPGQVKVEMEHAIQAAHPKDETENKANEIELTGAVEAVSNGTMTVAGRTFAITDQTEVKGSVQVGDIVKVHLVIGVDGSLSAREVEITSGSRQRTETGDDRGTPEPEIGDDKGKAGVEINDDNRGSATEIEIHQGTDDGSNSGSTVDDKNGTSSGSPTNDHNGTSGSSSGGTSGSGSGSGDGDSRGGGGSSGGSGGGGGGSDDGGGHK